MNESTRQSHLEQFSHVFSHFTPQDVEQFYAIYQRWSLYQELETAQQKLAALHEHMAENAAQIERVRPSAIALATLTRLQASGVEDIDLLDSMLERGEDWLDRTIQHLEYCEQQGVVGDDYEEWCRHALEDAFDWLDTLHAASETAPVAPKTASPALTNDDQPASNQTTEELLLQKLMSEDIEPSTLEETTLKIATLQPATETNPNDVGAQFIAPAPEPSSDDQHGQSPSPTGAIHGAPTPVVDEDAAPTDSEHNQSSTSATSDTTAIETNTPASNDEEIVGAQFIAPVVGMGDGEVQEQNPTSIEPQKQEETAPRRPHFLRRLLLALWR